MKKNKPFIPEDLQVVDLNVFHLLNLQNLLIRKNQKPEEKIIIIYGKNKIYKIYSTKKGRLNKNKYNNFLFDKNILLKKIAKDFQVKQIMAFSENFLSKFFTKFQKVVSYQDDYVKQLLTGLKIFSLALNKSIYFYPEIKIPKILMNYNFFYVFFRLFFPLNYDFLFIVLAKEKINTSLVFRIRKGQIKTISTLEYFTNKEKILGKNLSQRVSYLLADIPELYPLNFVLSFEKNDLKKLINSTSKVKILLSCIKRRNVFLKLF